MVVDAASRNFCDAKPRVLIHGLHSMWTVSSKGDFFITLALREPPQIHLAFNWLEELKRLAPPVG
jgi:hypothetical protein